MNDINQRCVSLASGVLSPDLRVNYEFGLVLGVDEFKQEQMYFLEKDYLHNRALHGYGTVYGLKVEATRPADEAKDVLITVEPGLGIDQCGRYILLRNAQCARLKAWLKKQPSNVVAQHQDASGDMHLYVVASYDECLEALVPIPGAPCSSSESTSAPSRIRDSFNLELRWEPPRMAAWAAVDLFARLMGHVRFVPHLSALDSDEGRIIALVRELDNPDAVFLLPGSEFFLDSPPTSSPPDSPPESPPAEESFLRLPLETAHEALDRIFTVWVTEVRPRIQPSLSDSCSPAMDAGILLARLDFGLANNNTDIVDLGVPDDTGRPFLLHTQLIQELLFHGGNVDVVQQQEREFATLQVRNAQTLRFWVHHPDVLVFPPGVSENALQGLALTSDGNPLTIINVAPVANLTNVFDLTTDSATLIHHGASVALTFELALLNVQRSDGSSLSLLSSIDTLGYAYVGRNSPAITAYTFAEGILTTREFVTFDTALVDGIPQLTLWFHDQQVSLTRGVGELQAFRGVDRQPLPFNLNAANGATYSFLWNFSAAETRLTDQDLLTFSFDTDRIQVGTDDANARTLTSIIREQQLAFVGYDDETHTITAFYEVNVPQQVVQNRPPLPFVTLTPLTVSRGQELKVELWFHLDLDPVEETAGIDGELNPETFKVFAELRKPVKLEELKVTSPQLIQHNVFSALLSWPRGNISPDALHLRFVFSPEMKLTNSQGGTFSLGEYIANNSITFEGSNGKNIVAYLRVPTQSQG
jgi:hypothetical protein